MSSRFSFKGAALTVAAIYFVVGLSWVWWVSGVSAELAGDRPELQRLMQQVNGTIVVTLTSIGVYMLLAWHLERLRRVEEAKRQVEEMLRVSQRLEGLGRLAAIVVHDFNNVLSIMRGSTAMAAIENHKPERVAGRIHQIERAINQADGIVQQLRMFIRNAPDELSVVNPVEVVRRTEPLLKQAVGRHAELKLDLPAQAVAEVRMNTMQVEQCLLNLTLNARDAMADRPRKVLRVRVEERVLAGYTSVFCPKPVSGRFVVVQVTDSGRGISEQNLVHIFTPFYSTKPAGEGTGLGLASVLRILQHHGGWVEVSSREGEGATFLLMFPAVAEAAKSEGEPPTPSARTKTQGLAV